MFNISIAEPVVKLPSKLPVVCVHVAPLLMLAATSIWPAWFDQAKAKIQSDTEPKVTGKLTVLVPSVDFKLLSLMSLNSKLLPPVKDTNFASIAVANVTSENLNNSSPFVTSILPIDAENVSLVRGTAAVVVGMYDDINFEH